MQNWKRKAPRAGGAEYMRAYSKLYAEPDYTRNLTAETIAHALDKPHRSGDGWVACCPAHDDKSPSLSINDCYGRVLVHCHAGCPQDSVIDALRGLGLWHTVRPEIAEQRKRDHAAEKLKSRLNTIKMIADADRASGKDRDWSDQDSQLAKFADKAGGADHE